jgi:Protein of Unknown function (DUF2784)
MPYGLMADLLTTLHALFVLFVLTGLALVLIGWGLRWAWVRNVWFRAIHLLAIVFVATQAWLGQTCPLTLWENQLRQRAGQTPYEGTFIGYWANRLLYYEAEPWVFTLAYTLFALAVLAAFIFCPPGRRGGRDLPPRTQR